MFVLTWNWDEILGWKLSQILTAKNSFWPANFSFGLKYVLRMSTFAGFFIFLMLTNMTSLLPHTVAQPTKWRFLPKNLSQLVIFVIELAFTWSWVDKYYQNLIFKVSFLCQKSLDSFLFFSLKNKNLAHLLITSIFLITLFSKMMSIFDSSPITPILKIQ